MNGPFVRIHDVGDALLNYIGTEEFARATDHLSPESRSSFMSGIGMAGVLIMANCPKYYGAGEDEFKAAIDYLQKENDKLRGELYWAEEAESTRDMERLEESARNGDVYL